MAAVLSGQVINGGDSVRESKIGRFSRDGADATMIVDGDAMFQVPLSEPIRIAIVNFNAGRFGAMAHNPPA